MLLISISVALLSSCKNKSINTDEEDEYEICQTCEGEGFIVVECDKCEGEGEIEVECEECDGTGKEDCIMCFGNGKEE